MSQHKRGSSYHLLQWTRMYRTAFAKSLTEQINLPDVAVAIGDWWRPDCSLDGDFDPFEARTETLPSDFLSKENKLSIKQWWLKHQQGANTPN